jgi:RNA polymerase sigma factor (TIGR02999 family)
MDDPEITTLIHNVARGDLAARGELFRRVEHQLRAIATRRLRHERHGAAIEVTLLIDDAFMRLVGKDMPWESRGHFYRAAAKAMRQILIDHARKRSRARAGGGWVKASVDVNALAIPGNELHLPALDDALHALERLDARQAEVVQLHFFGGFSWDEIAMILGVSRRTVMYDWKSAKAWLHKELSDVANR